MLFERNVNVSCFVVDTAIGSIWFYKNFYFMLFVNCILFDDVDISIDGSILIVSMIGLKVSKYRIVNVRRKEDTI